MKVLKLFFFLVFLVVLLFVGALGYLGFVPGLSTLMGADRPKDLGVRYTEENRRQGNEKSKLQYEALPADTPVAQSIRYTGKVDVTAAFTNEELSALASKRNWKYYPFTQVQIKSYGDGTAEVSAVLLKGRVGGWLAKMNVPQVAVDYISKALVLLPDRIPVYAAGKAALSENRISVFDLRSFEVGRFPAPASTVNKYKSHIVSFLNYRLTQYGGFYAKDAHFEKGSLSFDGSLAEKEHSVK